MSVFWFSFLVAFILSTLILIKDLRRDIKLHRDRDIDVGNCPRPMIFNPDKYTIGKISKVTWYDVRTKEIKCEIKMEEENEK